MLNKFEIINARAALAKRLPPIAECVSASRMKAQKSVTVNTGTPPIARSQL